MEEELRKKQEDLEAAQARERERKRLQKQGVGTKKLSFVMDVSVGRQRVRPMLQRAMVRRFKICPLP